MLAVFGDLCFSTRQRRLNGSKEIETRLDDNMAKKRLFLTPCKNQTQFYINGSLAVFLIGNKNIFILF